MPAYEQYRGLKPAASAFHHPGLKAGASEIDDCSGRRGGY
jgi:hypothetical protein